MDGIKEFSEIEWIIENFSCWNSDVHGECIELKDVYGILSVFPRRFDGKGENLLVTISCPPSAFSGDLFFLDADGSILFKIEVKDSEWKGNSQKISTGWKFSEISEKIKVSSKDIIILRYHLRCRSIFDNTRARTVIDVSDFCFRVPSMVFREMPWCQSAQISCIYYPGTNMPLLNLVVSLTKTGCVVFKSFRTDTCKGSLLIRACLSVSNKDGNIVHLQENENVFKNVSTWILSTSLSRTDVLNSDLTLLLKLKIVLPKTPSVVYKFSTKEDYLADATKSDETSKTSNDPETSISVLSKELEYLYQDQEFSDFRIHCGTVCFPTHKGILSARSPVFKSMLSSNMREATSGSMEISDIDVHTLGRFLAFLYTGCVNDLSWESALKLYYTADKYEVPSLKRECSAVLVSNVSVSNVCEILSLGEAHEDEGITSAARDFISKNYDEVLNSEEWKSFMKKDPYLLLKTVTVITTKKK